MELLKQSHLPPRMENEKNHSPKSGIYLYISSSGYIYQYLLSLTYRPLSFISFLPASILCSYYCYYSLYHMILGHNHRKEEFTFSPKITKSIPDFQALHDKATKYTSIERPPPTRYAKIQN